jgi:hypothetical protein
MAPEPNIGPNYPWGDDPWPGTDHIKDELKKHSEAKDELWFNQTEFDALFKRLDSWRTELHNRKVGGKTARENLVQTGNLKVEDIGQWLAGSQLHKTADIANNVMLPGLDFFLSALDALINRMKTTGDTNTGVEVDNVDVVTFHNILTVEPGTKPPQVPPAQTNQPGQSNPAGQPAQPGSYS